MADLAPFAAAALTPQQARGGSRACYMVTPRALVMTIPETPTAAAPSELTAAAEPSPRERRHSLLLRLAALLAAAAWLGLTTWRLDSVPGMVMDEAWYIVSTNGEWPPENPLSGLTAYSGPFPLLLLELFGTKHGLLVLRGSSVLANGITLLLIARWLARLYPAQTLAGWAVPLIATCPIWLVTLRTGIEVLMFTPLLAVLGAYLCSLGTRWAAWGAGLSFGLLIYNHLIGVAFPLGFAFAWLCVHRRLPRLRWPSFGLGLGLGVLPRIVAIVLYPRPLEGSGAQWSPSTALADLRWLPKAYWESLLGETVYLRYAGRIAVEVWPYWALALVLFLPWWRRPWTIPRPVWFMLLLSLATAALVTCIGPYMAVRFFLLPVLAFAVFVALLGAATIEAWPRFRHVVRAVGVALTACNLFYFTSNFVLPWRDRDLGITAFFLGERSPRTSSWGYLPKDELVDALSKLTPRPEQVITNATIDRPLRALLHGSGIRSAVAEQADPKLRSVFVDYRMGKLPQRRCLRVQKRNMCFGSPQIVSKYFLVYR